MASPTAGSKDGEDRRDNATQVHQKVQGLFPLVQYLTYDQFVDLLEPSSSSTSSSEKPVLIDVREDEEINTGTLPNAIPVTEARKQEWDQKRKIICFCTVGLRSGIEAERLRQQGYIYVSNYSIMEHVWGNVGSAEGEHNNLVKLDGSQWDGSIHIYSRRYEEMMPQSTKLQYFSTLTALMRGFSSVPGLISAIGSGGRWQKASYVGNDDYW